MKFDLNKLVNLFDDVTSDVKINVDVYRRIQKFYSIFFSTSSSNDVDFSSFTREDALEALSDAYSYCDEEDDAVDEDNSGVVLYAFNQMMSIKTAVLSISPKKIPLDFF